jgi:alkylation response protein AidB-like acyl-CoA dehydrogenase
MDFSWSEEQRDFRDKVVRFAREELNDDLTERDRQGEFSRELWQKCAVFGIQGLAMPEPYSGTPAVDIMTAMLAMEGLGYGCRDNGLTFALNAQMWTVQLPILRFGTEAQQQRFLPGLCDGTRIGVHAVTEAEAGSDVFSLQTEARPCEGGYVLNGVKQYVSMAPIADLALVFATIDSGLGQWGITAFVVERERDGFRVGASESKMGLRTVPIGKIMLEDCFVPAENRIGPEGAGFSISNHSLEYERCCILGSQLGAMERQLDAAVRHARTRQQFGQPIGKFQSVSNRVADMKLRLETARLLLYKVAWLKREGRPAMMEAALLKLYLSECFVASGMDAIRVHGGSGYMTATEVERDLRDAIGGTLYAGTSDIQRNIIARLLGL